MRRLTPTVIPAALLLLVGAGVAIAADLNNTTTNGTRSESATASAGDPWTLILTGIGTAVVVAVMGTLHAKSAGEPFAPSKWVKALFLGAVGGAVAFLLQVPLGTFLALLGTRPPPEVLATVAVPLLLKAWAMGEARWVFTPPPSTAADGGDQDVEEAVAEKPKEVKDAGPDTPAPK